MTGRISKDAEKKIADIFGELDEKLAELAKNIMNRVFNVGSAELAKIQTNVSGCMAENTKTTKELNAIYHSSAGFTQDKPPTIQSPTPSIGPSAPTRPTTPGAGGGYTPP